MTGKEYLQRIKMIDTQIKNKNYELKQLRASGLPSGLILDGINELQLGKQAIIKTMERLKESEYDVLHMVYVQGKTLYEVADARKISYSSATSIHGIALKKVEEIINEKEN